ncbi:SPOR domain-containing protein [Hydrogenivirga sp. 128-5-R1-1]|uniref:SPOR domain-containing protein n=1 Tax=Hydrogenivirga sp. 128-5-R1-1 TaxID=392423 RepID=UPI00015F3655|nr:SPOR domain-containing protein [Hydrogenivirga sp. 128-5-R1-1]EDP76559.1 hypothetical protein HG1285_03093 [Hydrogenivirga sp. 128-5-R1-1]
MIRLTVALLVLVSVSLSAPLKYCIQVAAEKRLELIKNSFKKVEDFPKARIEKRQNLYLLRVGAEDRKENLYVMLRKIRKFFPDAFIKRCEIRDDYVVYPKKEVTTALATEKPEEKKEERPPKRVEPKPKEQAETKIEATKKEKPEKRSKPPVKSPVKIELKDDKEIKELLISIKNELSIIREELKKKKGGSPRGSEENPAYFEKFLYSVGIFTGGLFLFTWILLIALYRKIGASNVENANLLNDMFKLIKVLNLLNKGQIIKMENGKLLIYDRKNERWKEVD